MDKELERRKKLFEDYLHSEEYQKKLIQRLQINDACNKKAEAKGITWNLCARPDNPAEGAIFFIENFGWTFDPRPQANPNHLPFILFDYQRDAIGWIIEHIDSGKNGLIEKSRDMGVTWLIVYVVIWYWLFRDGINILLGSYKQDLVDDRTKDSLFGMIDYAVDSFPKWLLPRGFKKDKHRNQMKLVNPINNNLIAGDTMNPDFGRGKRKTVVLFDELASWDYAREAWESSSDVTACKIGVSTPKGMNFFGKLRRDTQIDVSTLHWKQHPLKDQQWYQYENDRRTEEEVAQELDISYNKSQEGRVYPEWNEQNVGLGLFEYDPNLPLYVGWDFGYTDDTAIIWAQPCNGKLRIVDSYSNRGKTIDFYIPFVTGIVQSDYLGYSNNDLEMIGQHKYWKRGTHFGDPAARFTNQVVNSSVIDILRNNGIVINFNDSWKEFQKRKTAAKLLIRDGIELNKNARTDRFNDSMTQASYPSIKTGGSSEVRSIKPKHDSTSHYRSAFEYLALGLQENRNKKFIPFDKFRKKETFNNHKVLRY